MLFITRKVFIWYLKNPLTYIGAILVFLLVYSSCSGYFKIHYFTDSEKIPNIAMGQLGNVDVFDGYIPVSEQEKFQNGLVALKSVLIDEMDINEKEAQKAIGKIQSEQMSYLQIKEFFNDNYHLKNAQLYFVDSAEAKKGTSSEINQYIRSSLAKENYSEYFGRKISDYLGVAFSVYSLILLLFLFIYDYKRDLYELLHTKPIKSWKYILGKAFGGILSLILVMFVITSIFDIIVFIQGVKNGFPVNLFDMWYYVALFNIPNIIYIGVVYTFLASIFKTPLPAIPLLVLQIIYSNLGQRDELGKFMFINRPLSILVRFPEMFFNTDVDKVAYINQGILMGITILFAIGAIYQWNRRTLI